MTYPDDVLKAAREAAAKLQEHYASEVQPARHHKLLSEGILRGDADAWPSVQAACIAIMAERQAVVAWLRPLTGAERMMMPQTVADAIERGEHRQAPMTYNTSYDDRMMQEPSA